MDSVWGTVNYLAAGSTRNRLYVAPGEQRATARYEAHRVRISDGRPHRDDLTLDTAGFALVDHQTSVPALPDPGLPDAPDDEAESAASLFHYNAAHRWWYFPGMHAGEALLIKLHDTDHSVAWRAPHTSFRDDAAGAQPRESVELRTVAYFR